ncbi:MAG: 50S ribosomal protein L21 [Deltaproteobacteria bacterium]|nr:50S ribosomal protein L21 [Deltaproteobacteria bacterium]
MYAVIKTGGKQYRVAPGQTVRVEKLDGNIGDEITIKDVLLVADGEQVKVGQPLLAEAEITVKIVEQHKERKILVFKKKRRKGFTKAKGHRQYYTAIRVQEIKA